MGGHGYEQSRAFLRHLEQLQSDYRRIDEFLEAVEFVLNRDTTRVGLLVYEKDDVRIWRTKSIKTTGLPALHVYYSFVGGSVIYLGIKKAHAGLNGASHKS